MLRVTDKILLPRNPLEACIGAFDRPQAVGIAGSGNFPDGGLGYLRSTLDAMAHAVRTVRMKLPMAILATFK
jgi:hypothetical protein